MKKGNKEKGKEGRKRKGKREKELIKTESEKEI